MQSTWTPNTNRVKSGPSKYSEEGIYQIITSVSDRALHDINEIKERIEFLIKVLDESDMSKEKQEDMYKKLNDIMYIFYDITNTLEKYKDINKKLNDINDIFHDIINSSESFNLKY